ncbi:MAG TPA: protein kinase, partial [Polyangiaceae bacterium]|nr:protein kinase [Polyangiaceae bacterium]
MGLIPRSPSAEEQEPFRTASAPLEVAERALIGGRYRIDAELGRGGMGAAFRAVDEATGRVLALKVLTAMTPGALALFEREYQTLASIQHPCVIEVYDFGVTADGARFYTMEFLEGQDLYAIAPVPWRTLCAVIRDVATSLALLHARKLLHRDVSPRNIRVTQAGRAKLLDFGALAGFGTSSDLVGTPTCIAPETIECLELDARTDLFSLGVVAYLCLTRRRPYAIREFADVAVAWAVRPTPPSELVPGVPPALDQLILSLLDTDPSGRPASAAEVIDRLNAIAELEEKPLAGVIESHLTGSALTGRAREQLQLRHHLDGAREGAGHAVVLEGAAGMGSSRLSRELAITARLSGMVAVHVAALAHSEPGGSLRALVAGVFEAAPADAQAEASKHPELVRILDALRGKLRPSQLDPKRMLSAAALEEQAGSQLRVVDWLVEVAKRRPLLIVVDDAHAADLTSAGALVVLAHSARRAPLLLLVTLSMGEKAPVAIEQLTRTAARIKLRGLEQASIEELVRSAFGDVPHSLRLAAWVHSVAQGNPGHSLTLLRNLVERRIIRYAGGTWVLPAGLSELGLPESVEEALVQRISELGHHAQELAQILALHRGTLSLSSACALFPGVSVEDLSAAVSELLAREIAAGSEQMFRIAQERLRSLLVTRIADDHKQRLHVLLGRALISGSPGMDRATLANSSAAELGKALQAGWHLLRGGEED